MTPTHVAGAPIPQLPDQPVTTHRKALSVDGDGEEDTVTSEGAD